MLVSRADCILGRDRSRKLKDVMCVGVKLIMVVYGACLNIHEVTFISSDECRRFLRLHVMWAEAYGICIVQVHAVIIV